MRGVAILGSTRRRGHASAFSGGSTPPPIEYSGRNNNLEDPSDSCRFGAKGVGRSVDPVVLPLADYFGSPISQVCSPVFGSLFPVGTTTVNCTATDSWGRTASGYFRVDISQFEAQI